MIRKLELCLLVVIILFKIEFGHVQVNVPKVSKLMLKTACTNPCLLQKFYQVRKKELFKETFINQTLSKFYWKKYFILLKQVKTFGGVHIIQSSWKTSG